MIKTRVLVAGSGNVTGLNIIQGLLEGGYEIIGCDNKNINPANIFCENYQIPSCSSKNYRNAILNLVDNFHITHIIATNDHDVRALFSLYCEFKKRGIFLNGYEPNMLNFLDKRISYEIFMEKQILTPRMLESSCVIPYVLRKKEMGNVNKFVHIVKCKKDEQSITEEEIMNGIFTEYIDGEEYTIDLLCDNSSNLLSAIPRLRIDVKNGMVNHAKIVYDKELLQKVKEFVNKVGLTGMNCVQCIRNRNKYYFIEINPRPGSGIDLSIKGGVNMPCLWIKMTLNESFEIKEPLWGLQMLRYYSGYYF